MKKILLLLAASLVLLVGCQKDGPQEAELVTDSLGSVIPQEYICPKCGAKYSVTCKNLKAGETSVVVHVGENDWNLCPNPLMGGWAVTDESGQNVPYYEYWLHTKMYFICTCGEKSKEFKKDEFKTQEPVVPGR